MEVIIRKIQRRVFKITQSTNNNDPFSKGFELFIIFLILINSVTIMADTFPLPQNVKTINSIIDVSTSIIFSIEYVLRVLKINRFTDAITKVVAVSSILMYDIENAAQPETFTNILDSMWWAVSTFTTIGYGDIYPITTIGKILSAVIAFLGIGLVAVPTGIISAGFVEQIAMSAGYEKSEKHYCPYCGKQLD